MQYKIGKVKEYDGYVGEIVTEDNLYYFTKNDINDGEVINKSDIVRFDSKCDDSFPQAYYIEKFDSEKI